MVLVVLGLTQLMVALDATVISIALPRAQVALHFSAGDRQWAVTAYALAFGSLLLIGGRLGDLWGRRTALVVGLVGFALASAVGGFASNFTELVAARAVQGAFSAILAPAALAALTTTFTDRNERARAFTIYGALAGSGAAIGLILGGALTQWASWRWCLLINVVFSLVALVGVVWLIESRPGAKPANLDVTGAVLVSAGLFAIVFGLAHAVTATWASVVTIGSLLAGAVLLVVFLNWQRRSDHPLLPLSVVFARTRGGSMVALFITMMGFFGVSLLLAYYLQNELGYSPLRTGIAFLPMVIALGFSAMLASARILAVSGPRPLIPAGMLLGALSMVLLTRLPERANYFGTVLPSLILLGLGLGLIFAPATASATAGVAPSRAGVASAMVNSSQQIGGSVGTALFNTIAVTVAGRALTHTSGASPSVRAAAATLHGYSIAFWWAAGIFFAGAVFTMIVLESGAPELTVEGTAGA